MIEYDPELDAELVELHKKYPRNYIRSIKSKGFKGRYPDRTYLVDYIMRCTPMLEDTQEFTYSLMTRLYWVLNKIESWEDERVKCKVCGNPLKNINVIHLEGLTYKNTCSYKCERKLAQKNMEENLLKNEGITNVFQRPSVLAKLEAKKDEMQQHREETKLRKFGNRFYNNPKQAKETKIEKYGMVWNLEACKKTWLDKYGVESPMQVLEIAEKQKNVAYMLDDKKFDSSLEVYLYLWLKEHNVKFIYHPDEPRLWYQKANDKGTVGWHRYYPDFLMLEDGPFWKANQFLETKGNNAFDEEGRPIKNGHEDWTEKYQCMLEHDVVLMMTDDIDPIKEEIENKYGKDYALNFKVNQDQ